MENWMIDTVGMLGTVMVVLAYYLLGRTDELWPAPEVT